MSETNAGAARPAAEILGPEVAAAMQRHSEIEALFCQDCGVFHGDPAAYGFGSYAEWQQEVQRSYRWLMAHPRMRRASAAAEAEVMAAIARHRRLGEPHPVLLSVSDATPSWRERHDRVAARLRSASRIVSAIGPARTFVAARPEVRDGLEVVLGRQARRLFRIPGPDLAFYQAKSWHHHVGVEEATKAQEKQARARCVPSGAAVAAG